jgi:hypothetical protein
MGLCLYKHQFEGVFMKGKIKVGTLIFLVLMAVGAYAQNVSLREGYYQTQGSADHIYVAPNRELSERGNTPENAFSNKRGSYGVLVWIGLPEPSNIVYGRTGNIVSDEFRINIQRLSSKNIESAGLTGLISRGTLTIWNIVDNETFADVAGQRWIWRRQR